MIGACKKTFYFFILECPIVYTKFIDKAGEWCFGACQAVATTDEKFTRGFKVNPAGCSQIADEFAIQIELDPKIVPNNGDMLPAGLVIDDLNQNVFKVYPNPTEGNLNIELRVDFQGIVEIYNLNGQIVQRATLDQKCHRDTNPPKSC